MAKLALPPPLDGTDDIDDIDDVGDGLADFLGLEGPFLDPIMLKTSAQVAGGGALAAVGLGILTKQPTVAQYLDAPWKKMLVTAGVGIIAGRLLWDKNRALALGVIGAAGGILGTEIVNYISPGMLAGTPIGFLGAAPEEIPLAGYLGNGEDDEELGQTPQELLGDVSVEEKRGLLGEASVETRRPELADIGAWIS